MRASSKHSLAVLGRSLLQRKSYAAAPETGEHAISHLHAFISMRNVQIKTTANLVLNFWLSILTVYAS